MSDFEPDPDVAYANFTMDCPTCGPATIVFENSQQKPHGCPYKPPSFAEFEIGPEGFTSWPDGEPVNFATGGVEHDA